MADDETIVIRVDSKQAEAALKALGDAGIQTGKDLETIGDDGGEKVKSLGDRSAEAAPKMGSFGESAQSAGLNIKDMTKSIGAGISIVAILRENLAALEPVQQEISQAFRDGAVAAGADAETTDNLVRAMDSLLHPTHIAKNAIESLSIALEKAIPIAEKFGLTQKQAAETAAQAWARQVGAVYEAVQAMDESNAAIFGNKQKIAEHTEAVITSVGALLKLGGATEEQMERARSATQVAIDDELAAFGKIPPALQAIADKLGVTSSLQQKSYEDTQKASEEFEKASIKSADERAKAEAAAAEKIIKSLEEQRVKREELIAQLDAEILRNEERLKAQTAGGTVVEEFLPEGAPEEVQALKNEMRALENQPFLDSGQQQRVEELKNKIADAGSQILKTYGVWKATNEMADGTHEAFNAAWDAYIARLNKSEVQHQNVMDDLDRLENTYDEFGGVVDDVGGSLEDVAQAAGELGDKADKGTKKATEGLDNLKAGAEEAIPLLEQIKGLLAEIKQAASEVEL